MFSLFYKLSDLLRRRSYAENHGRIGEDLAHRFLRGEGLTIVARNYRPQSGAGEIDLIAWHADTLVFVEVKARSTDEFGEPERAVDLEKQITLDRTARDYARRSGVEWIRTRFDIVSIVLGKTPRIEWMRDAFRIADNAGQSVR